MRAYAKINVGLWIKERREDGYHELETIFLPIELYDEISVETSDRFRIDGPNFGEDDLMYKAHRYLEARYGDLPVRVTIDKHIPVGAGLAGGTSDGAAVLKGVRDLYELPLSDVSLIEETSVLGADFPYCIYGKPALGTGIGDRLMPIEVPSFPLLLLNPGFSVSTKEAYGLWSSSNGGSSAEALFALKRSALGELKNVVVNDLMPGVAKRHGEIEAMVRALYERGAAFADMTGSGPTVYGIFENDGDLNRAYAILKDKYEVVIKTRTRTSGEENE
ncbi:MAG: 4-(cytidine 5'-diphospho)-2-C-methyl-D-erythritol kinase [Peptoniphilus sp.]|nr:4-(cytidine 5'-diphospho)-2-C-methyl-D-erythritol kinase [Peptoniphilus sp.]MDD7362589.1 4-(cytidine 5'-diphospho)-2-C-methyl-D-erythritol kinase [Bacillota bacterium]MDY6045012.1 4-(cytidine 5'-diphospho)-2-C-methyl-D-erythritol kinase [Peptoniphilus sp.]